MLDLVLDDREARNFSVLGVNPEQVELTPGQEATVVRIDGYRSGCFAEFTTPELEAFCAAAIASSSGERLATDAAIANYAALAANAPVEFAADVAEFARLFIGITERGAPLLDVDGEIDQRALFEALTEEQRVFLAEISEGASSGVSPDTPAGRTVEVITANCL